jgi:hypothetical protein
MPVGTTGPVAANDLKKRPPQPARGSIEFSFASRRVNLPLYVFLVAMINDGGLAWIDDCF